MTESPPPLIVAVVDDDQSILRSIEYLLQSGDYAVRAFTSASALLESGCLAQVHCLISDIDMPNMDGLELLRLVNTVRPDLPSIVITGYPERLQRLQQLDAKHPRFFTKPFQGEELLAAVREALRGCST